MRDSHRSYFCWGRSENVPTFKSTLVRSSCRLYTEVLGGEYCAETAGKGLGILPSPLSAPATPSPTPMPDCHMEQCLDSCSSPLHNHPVLYCTAHCLLNPWSHVMCLSRPDLDIRVNATPGPPGWGSETIIKGGIKRILTFLMHPRRETSNGDRPAVRTLMSAFTRDEKMPGAAVGALKLICSHFLWISSCGLASLHRKQHASFQKQFLPYCLAHLLDKQV